MSVGIIHKHYVIEKQILCISTQSHIKDIAKICDCITPLHIKINVKILTNVPYSLFIWSMVLAYIVQVAQCQFIFQFLIHMFVFHCFVTSKTEIFTRV